MKMKVYIFIKTEIIFDFHKCIARGLSFMFFSILTSVRMHLAISTASFRSSIGKGINIVLMEEDF